ANWCARPDSVSLPVGKTARSHRLSPDLSTAERGRGERMRNVTLPVAAAALLGFLAAPLPIMATTALAASALSTGAADNDAHYVPLHDHDLADSPAFVRDPLPGLIEELFAGRPRDRGPGSRQDHEAAAKFYAGRDHAPVWVEGGRFSSKARRAIFRLARADA